jgi:hypothetical protein
MGSRAVLTLEALEHYDKKIKDYIDMRCYEIVRESLQEKIDSRMEQEVEVDKDENKYYYPLFERRVL